MKNTKNIFKQGSKTFYTASLFFPKDIRKNVTRLYAFVRIADNFVDQIPQDKVGFYKFKKQTNQAFSKKKVSYPIVQDFVLLCREFNIEKTLVDSFLASMQQDFVKKKYDTFEELEEYMYGSAEVIGIMMSRVLRLPKKAEDAARYQGKAMQLLNFIRDIKEDIALGRQYIPQKDLRRFSIRELSADVNEGLFTELISYEINRFENIQAKAKKGYDYIPHSSRVPIATAAAMYEWTANEIKKNPMTVFSKKVKPSKTRIFAEYLKQLILL